MYPIGRLTLHFLVGLSIGMCCCAIHVFAVVANQHGKATAATGTALLLGLIWPAVASLVALARGLRNPWAPLSPWITFPLIVILLPLSAIASAFMVFLSMMAGYC